MSYANFFKFGSSINNNIKFVNDPANPLTQAVMPNYNTQFNHGPTANFSSTWAPMSVLYMKELAIGLHGAIEKWNTYCQAYYAINTDTTKPNLGAINARAFNAISSMINPPNTVGQNLLRNTLELYCIYYPSATFLQKQFDPNIANSPIIHIPTTICGNCPAIVHLPENPDDDRILNTVLNDPFACTDVLCYIWAALSGIGHYSNIRLSNPQWANGKMLNGKKRTESKLYKLFTDKHKYYTYYFQHIMKVLGNPCDCAKCTQTCVY